ncbi:UDP-N-acetylmuramoyl-tripeptide--D-alanyl-D-alanine ligase [Marinimicrobium koreense]|jgi:UDP-N-acetylmuramoyl-tripeptide--D-alanyl-D-alanine ligase|uniref:UDP-N-acetylmuramoyl-tripeptide--D-alanyl-D- alanine ligase n=1 Tax=Marinimicrobium koreense TaxID=306545 RepID=UPI003F6E8792
MIGTIFLSELNRRFGGELNQGDVEFRRLSTDTRTVQAGDLFLALRGERFDGHEFVQIAVDRGACGVVVDQPVPDLTVPQWVVPDTLAALGQVALLNRERFRGPLVAITGSSGKTTVRTMLAGILVRAGGVLATRGNLNNHIGVPLTLLELDEHHEYAVIEMGASGPGEIASYCQWAKPDVALINNVMPAHIEGFGSVEGVARAKGEIYTALDENGIAVINRDDAFASYWLSSLGGRRVISVSLDQQEADCRARDIEYRPDSVLFTLITGNEEARVQLAVPGEHSVRNALAAAGCALALGLSAQAIARGLESFEPVAGRMSARRGWADALIIDDSYNANPGSVRAAIEVLAAHQGKRILVLGDMGELGEHSAELHREVGDRARERGLDRLVTLGPLSAQAAEAFGEGASAYRTHEEVIEALKGELDEHTRVLIKGSRSAGMDRVVRGLSKIGDQD